MRSLLTAILCVGIVVSASPVVEQGYYQLKSIAAQHLLNNAWLKMQQNGLSLSQKVKPWPWADSWPLFKLHLPNTKSLVVMSSSSGESLAFGPGLHSSQVLPGDIGNSLIAAHRDTHFADIQSLQMGELIRVENSSGVFLTFEIDDIRVVDSRLEVPVLESDISRVTLISCYPFDSSVKDPPLRFLVSAKRVV